MRKDFRIGQKITLKVEYSRRKYKLIRGVVADKTDYLVLVKWKKHENERKESFRYMEFCLGEVRVV